MVNIESGVFANLYGGLIHIDIKKKEMIIIIKQIKK